MSSMAANCCYNALTVTQTFISCKHNHAGYELGSPHKHQLMIAVYMLSIKFKSAVLTLIISDVDC